MTFIYVTGLAIAGVRYEDLLKDPKRSVNVVFRYCGLLEEPKAIERAFSRDSQENTILSRDNLSMIKSVVISDDMKRQFDIVCDYNKVYGLYVISMNLLILKIYFENL